MTMLVTDKPEGMTDKEWLIKCVAVELGVHSSVVDKVVTFEFEELVLATEKHSIIEISGLGRLLFNRKKAEAVLVSTYNLIEKIENSTDDKLQEYHRYKDGRANALKLYAAGIKKRLES